MILERVLAILREELLCSADAAEAPRRPAEHPAEYERRVIRLVGGAGSCRRILRRIEDEMRAEAEAQQE